MTRPSPSAREQSQRVVITGMGAVTAVGESVPSLWTSLLAGRSGVGTIKAFDPSDLPTRFAAQVDMSSFDRVPPRLTRRLDRFAVLALAAAAEAIDEAGLMDSGIDPRRIGVCIGNCCSAQTMQHGAFESLTAHGYPGIRRQFPYLATADCISSATSECARLFGFTGPSWTVATECASGTTAIGQATLMIRVGLADVVVCGGAEAPISPFVMSGLCTVGALSTQNDDPATACRPFDSERTGFVLGEGAGVVVLESMAHAAARGASWTVEVSGYGTATDTYHATAPDPDGAGASAAVEAAVADAGLSGDDIDVVNTHGTGTPLNDVVELKALSTALGPHARALVHSIKPSTGHTLAATGAIEAIALAMTLTDQLVPHTLNCDDPVPTQFDIVRTGPRQARLTHGLSTSLGFGGQCAALVLSRTLGVAA